MMPEMREIFFFKKRIPNMRYRIIYILPPPPGFFCVFFGGGGGGGVRVYNPYPLLPIYHVCPCITPVHKLLAQLCCCLGLQLH